MNTLNGSLTSFLVEVGGIFLPCIVSIKILTLCDELHNRYILEFIIFLCHLLNDCHSKSKLEHIEVYGSSIWNNVLWQPCY